MERKETVKSPSLQKRKGAIVAELAVGWVVWLKPITVRLEAMSMVFFHCIVPLEDSQMEDSDFKGAQA